MDTVWQKIHCPMPVTLLALLSNRTDHELSLRTPRAPSLSISLGDPLGTPDQLSPKHVSYC